MRPKHPHAAESGVGKHIARESERVQACAAGKERVTNAHPHNLALEPQGFRAILFLGEADPPPPAVRDSPAPRRVSLAQQMPRNAQKWALARPDSLSR